MQITNNYQSQPRFTSLRVDADSIENIMLSFKDCSTPRILKGVQVLKGMKNSSQTYKMRDFGVCAGIDCYGNMEITAGNKSYYNCNPFSLSGFRDIVYSLERAFKKGEKSNPDRMSKFDRAIQEKEHQIEALNLKKELKTANKAEAEIIRDGLLDYVFELIRR